VTIPTTGQVTLLQIQQEFGGTTPININEYYRGGTLVPSNSTTLSVPTSGTISIDNFHGASATGTSSSVVATVTPSSLYKTGTGTLTTTAATATGTGGTVTGYSWTRVSGDATITINSPTSSSTTFSGSVVGGAIKSATFKCTITFSGGATAFDTVDVTVEFDNGL
jgi:hypothetical protein